MTEKLYGLDDIPEGWMLSLLYILEERQSQQSFVCRLRKAELSFDEYVEVRGHEKTPQLALHRAIQKARGEA